MVIRIEDNTYNLEDFLFKNIVLTEKNPSNCLASEFLTSWISGGKAFKIQTSGSTGAPKFIELKRNWMVASALQTIDILSLWDENGLCCLPCDKIGGLMMIVRCLSGGFNLTIHEPKSDPLMQVDANHTFTLISLVPAQLIRILESKSSSDKLNKFKVVLVGGAKVPINILDKVSRLSPSVYLTYGMTETCSQIALQKLNHESWSCFRVNEFVDIKTNALDQLSVKGFQTGNEWIDSHDVVKMIDPKSFEFLGRSDFMINSGAFKIFPEQLEHKLLELFNTRHWTTQLAISEQPDETWGSKVVLVLNGKTDLSVTQILNYLRPHLLKYELPKNIIYMDEFPYTCHGKLDRLKLREMVLAIG